MKWIRALATFCGTEQAALPLREQGKFFRFWHSPSAEVPGAQQHEQPWVAQPSFVWAQPTIPSWKIHWGVNAVGSKSAQPACTISQQYLHEVRTVPMPKSCIPTSHDHSCGDRGTTWAVQKSCVFLSCSLSPSPVKGCNLSTSVNANNNLPNAFMLYVATGWWQQLLRLWNRSVKGLQQYRATKLGGETSEWEREGLLEIAYNMSAGTPSSYRPQQPQSQATPAVFTWR